ncbi:hypothetical protein DFH07DRAFT_1061768 [Mycena maculata]|uniref:Uncharacterized protein n=1 Tax=Mycena maculata TaxID=230809 RepID=A0AAD7IYC4_9AGAR|nr:hypothetical protein DFH07DRAFT_1061768 [Mycena maculata]
MLFFKKRSSVSSASSASQGHPGLKPLRLVEKLLAEEVIKPLPAPRVLVIQIPTGKKRPRPSLLVPKPVPSLTRVPSVPRPSVAKGPLPSSAGQTSVAPKKAPFVVPLHFSGPRVSRASPSTAPVAPRYIRIPKKEVVSKPVSRTLARTSRAPPASTRPTKAVPKNTEKAVPGSQIPVFVGRRSSDVFTPSPSPRIGASRIPRLTYAGSPASSRSSDTASGASSTVGTPCPSPVLVTGVRQAAPVVPIHPTTAIAKGSVLPAGKSEVPSFADRQEVSCPASDVEKPESPEHQQQAVSEDQRQRVEFVQDNGESTPAASLLVGNYKISTDPQDGTGTNILGALAAELKARLSRKKAPIAATPSTTSSPFVLLSRSDDERFAKENGEKQSELQQVFARRRSAFHAASSPVDSKQTVSVLSPSRRPLASVPHAINNCVPPPRPCVPNGTPGTMPPHACPPFTEANHSPLAPVVRGVTSACAPHVPTSTRAHPLPAETDYPPPGAEYITELVTTAFGTQKVRRFIIPPLVEGALPSRDPHIIMELERLRAKQKVGGGLGMMVGGGVGGLVAVDEQRAR